MRLVDPNMAHEEDLSMADRRLLIAFAHPDDESFGLGALIASYVAQGVKVYLICATDGDQGTVEPQYLNGYDSVRELRLAELECASQTLGFESVFTFGYSDSGMMGTPANDNPDCLWYAWHHQPEDLTRRVVDVMREVQPQVVITFNEYGGYGHPDHIAIQRATRQAFDLAADPDYDGSDHAPYQPQKLYYHQMPRSTFHMAVLMSRLRLQDPRRVGANKDIDLLEILNNIDPVHARVPISDYFDIWDQANACHASQGGGRVSGVPRWVKRLIASHQGFTRVIPAPASDRVDETDLFD